MAESNSRSRENKKELAVDQLLKKKKKMLKGAAIRVFFRNFIYKGLRYRDSILLIGNAYSSLFIRNDYSQ